VSADQVEILLDTNLCSAYGVCVSIMPDVFDTPPSSVVAVLLRDGVEADEREDLEEAVRACPAQALKIGDGPS
jgi:ferredoxin